ncbi:MAG: NUDIX hydrolase [bacterium]|nr:NUDIX hydrolase [bacterium]
MTLFWLGWPAWWLYFKRVPNRTRVIVTNNEYILLVKGWMGDGTWGLPGGGAKKNETFPQAAVRELEEETGIICKESTLDLLGSHTHREHGLTYNAHYFNLELKEIEPAASTGYEILACQWFKIEDIEHKKLNIDARYGLKHYLSKQ